MPFREGDVHEAEKGPVRRKTEDPIQKALYAAAFERPPHAFVFGRLQKRGTRQPFCRRS